LFANSRPARLGLSPVAGHLSAPGGGRAQGVPSSNHGIPATANQGNGFNKPPGGEQRSVGGAPSGATPAQNQAVGETNRQDKGSGSGSFKRGPVNSGTGTAVPTDKGAANPFAGGNNPPKPANGVNSPLKPSNGVPGNGPSPNDSQAKGGYPASGSGVTPRSNEFHRDTQHAAPPGSMPNRNTLPGAGPGGNPYVTKPPVQGAQGGVPAHVEGDGTPRAAPNAVLENNRVVTPPKNEPKNENKDKPKDKDK
jgi:hypothetical protein